MGAWEIVAVCLFLLGGLALAAGCIYKLSIVKQNNRTEKEKRNLVPFFYL